MSSSWCGKVGARFCASKPKASFPHLLSSASRLSVGDTLRRSIVPPRRREPAVAAAVITTFTEARRSRASSHGPNGDRSRFTRSTADRAPCTSSFLRQQLPRLLMPKSRALPPVECCRGTSPNQEAKSRPFRKAAPLPIAAVTLHLIPGITLVYFQSFSGI